MARRPKATSVGLLLPRFKAVTHNVTSLSAYSTNAEGIRRKQRMSNHLKQLAREHDVIHLQETKLGERDYRYLSHLLPDFNCYLYYNTLNKSRAGVATLVARSFAEHYKITPVTPKDDLKGRAVLLKFEGLENTLCDFTMINVYLPSGNNLVEKAKSITSLRSLIQDDLLFLSGDFNFVDDLEDGPTLLTGEAVKQWQGLLSEHSLYEVVQTIHTYSGSPGSSSRLDRFYTNIDYLDDAVNDCYTHVTAGCAQLSCKGSGSKKFVGQGHVPLSLSIGPKPSRRARPSYNVPKWLAEEPEFISHFYDKWHLVDMQRSSPFDQLRRWKHCVVAASKKYFAQQKRVKRDLLQGQATLSILNALHRLLSASRQNKRAIERMIQRHEWLEELVVTKDPRWLGEGIREKAADILATMNDPKQEDDKLWDEVNREQLVRSTGWRVLKGIKQETPTLRSRIKAVKEKADSAPTSDPDCMARILHQPWSQVWARRDLEDPDGYLDRTGYESEVKFGSQPTQSTVDDYIELIASSNDSCSGPDGIPFAIYRALVYVIAPILQKIEVALGEGYAPPDELGYNHARLFLIPKNHTLLPLDHRPISVTNADNRLVAQAVANRIVPALNDVLTESQKGFRPGYTGEEHIKELTSYYYSKLSKKQQAYILFMDIRKAFDSVSHPFIHAMLRRVGMASWVRRLVKLLLTDIRVTPVLGQTEENYIDIESGVKQGCPLSPLLFILCYDPLLKQIHKDESVQPKAYADDLAACAPNVEKVILVFDIFRKYGAASGLRMNKAKTKILTAKVMSKQARALLNHLGYHEIEAVNSAIYLGVLVGKVSTADIYANALKKFTDRLLKFGSLLKRCSLEKRIIIFNVFLLPIFSYLIQFYIVPPVVYNKVKELCRRSIIPFNGGAFAYAHLTTPYTNEGGFTRPLRDLWAANMTALAVKTDLTASHGLKYAHFEGYDHVNDDKWGVEDEFASMRIDEHRVHAGYVFLDDYAPRKAGLILSEDIHDDPKGRRTVYNCFARIGWHDVRCDQSPRSIQAKLKKWGIDRQDAAGNVKAHAKLAGKAASTLWNHHLRLIFNALPFDRRIRHFMKESSKPRSCLYCGLKEDSTYHVYAECELVKEARAAAFSIYSLQSLDNVEDVMLATPTATKKQTRVTLAYNYAVWRCRQDFLEPNTGYEAKEIVSRLCDITSSNVGRRFGRKVTYRTIGKKIAERPPANAKLIFTDGSARPNPGPAGAGVYSLIIDNEPKAYTANLGFNTNNAAELYAIGMAMEIIKQEVDVEMGDWRYVILSDSLLAINCVKKGTVSRTSKELARKVRGLYRLVMEKKRIDFIWVKGHEGIEGNEAADKAASEGAKISATLIDDDSRIHEALTSGKFTMMECLRTNNAHPASDRGYYNTWNTRMIATSASSQATLFRW